MRPLKSLEAQLARLGRLDARELGELHRRLVGGASAPETPRASIENAVAVQLQKQLIARLRSRLMQVSIAAESILDAAVDASDDTLLIRQWKGRCHLVTVAPDGVFYMGERYRDLDAVAHRITGGKHSGAQLFGGGGKHGR